MARYYCNIKEGETLIPDQEGDEFPDQQAVLAEIEATAHDIVERPNHYGRFATWARREFVVTDDDGREVLTVPLAALLLPQWRTSDV